SYRPAAVKEQLIPKVTVRCASLASRPWWTDSSSKHATGLATDVGSRLFEAQPWLSSRTARARCDRRSAALYPRRTQVGGRRGFGEILRPRQPRRVDGEACETHRRCALPTANPPLLGSWDTSKW